VNILFLIAGAALGATSRYFLSSYVASRSVGAFPWGTLWVNLLGCLFIGVLWGVATRLDFSITLRTFIFVGFLGSFTTFSSFGLESVRLIEAGQGGQAFSYIMLSNVGGMLLVWAGLIFARRFYSV
jgi:CrcB protein